MRCTGQMNYEVPTDLDQIILFAEYLIESANAAKLKEELEETGHRRGKAKVQSKADTVKELQQDIQYSRNTIKEYEDEMKENEKKLEDILKNGLPEPVKKKKAKKKVESEDE